MALIFLKSKTPRPDVTAAAKKAAIGNHRLAFLPKPPPPPPTGLESFRSLFPTKQHLRKFNVFQAKNVRTIAELDRLGPEVGEKFARLAFDARNKKGESKGSKEFGRLISGTGNTQRQIDRARALLPSGSKLLRGFLKGLEDSISRRSNPRAAAVAASRKSQRNTNAINKAVTSGRKKVRSASSALPRIPELEKKKSLLL